MLRFLFAFILGIHGFFHIMGFAKAANPSALQHLTHPVSKSYGSLWMVCAFMFVASAGTYVSRKDWWWMVGLAATVLSQLLIVRFWADAKFGTAVNALVLLAVVAGYGQWQFRQAARREVASLYEGIGSASVVVDGNMLKPLPPPVARWLERAGVVGQPLTRGARVRQYGEMRTAIDGNWMPVSAEQWFNAERPGFVWLAEVSAAPGFHIAGRDTFVNGKGRMLIKGMSVYPMADSTGPEIDQGAMVRFLAEILWMPSAALRDYIQWSATDAAGATATMTDGETAVSAVFVFDTNGDPANVTAQRYFAREGGATLETWHITIDPESYRSIQGIRVPCNATVSWKLPLGDFEWYRVTVDHVAFNRGET